ncbi:YxeA family protein [Viridibacillus sp. NPDC096237]|uniref:YxeA family protein n=1 Tax=Viridibacillus sp. NPDC096237 TaxID=3390721 RepID=UPI003D00F0C6
MKKFLIAVASLFLIGVIGIVVLKKVDLNRMNADNYYVHITEDGVKEVGKASDGKVFETYHYNLEGVNTKGEEKKFEFTASKNLRKDAYLMLYVKDGKGVSSYDEVKLSDIPKEAQAKLK